MDHKYRNTAVENLVESLSFEVEAVPQDNVPQYKSTSHITPVNVKVRVRKKDKSGVQKGTICIPKVARTANHPERIRLASSDQTIMSFNVLMEDLDNMKSKKKNVFGRCLNGTTEDDDDGPYLPKEEASGSKSGKQKLLLSKTAGNRFGDVKRKPKKFFGPCKPGGCLDPPFGEDRYSYHPPDMKKPTEDEIEMKIPESLDDKTIKETPNSSINKETDTKTPKTPPFDNTIDEKNPKPEGGSTEKKPSRCPKKDDTCPPFDYKVDPATIPFPLNGLGSAALGSNEGRASFDENEPFSTQRKRKGSSSDSACKVKISNRISANSTSVQSVSKKEKPEPLVDKESNSIITYAGDEDDIDNERMNKTRKSSVNTNRTSFDLNAPYYLPPKRDSRDKDTNEKTEKLRKSLEPLGKAQDENFPDERDDKLKRMLRMGIELQNEDAIAPGANGQSKMKIDENVKNTKYVQRPSLQKSHVNGINKLNDSISFPLDNTGKEINEGGGIFLDSPDDYDKTKPKTYDKDQIGTRGSISKKSDGAIEKYKTDDIFAFDNENRKDSDEKPKPAYSNQSNIGTRGSISKKSDGAIEKYKTDDIFAVDNENTKDSDEKPKPAYLKKSNASGFEKRNEGSFDFCPENDNINLKHKLGRGISDQDTNLQTDFNINQTEYPKKIDKLGLQSENNKEYFGHDKDDKNKLHDSSKDNQKSEYIESTTDSKQWHIEKEDKKNSNDNLVSKDIVTLKSGAFYKEISDAESDYKVTDSRSSLINKSYYGNDTTATVQTATDKDLSALIKTPITKIDINPKAKLHEVEDRVSNSHRALSVSPKYLDDDGFELGSTDSRNRDTESQKYEEILTNTGKDSDIDIRTQKYDKMTVKTGNSLNRDIHTESQKYEKILTKTGKNSDIDIRTQKYDKMTVKTGNGSNIDIHTQKYSEMSTKTGNGSNTDISPQKYDGMSTKRGDGSNIDIRTQKYDEISAKTGSDSNTDNIKIRKYDEMSTKTGKGSNIDIRAQKYDEFSATKGSNKYIRARQYDEMSEKTGENTNEFDMNISLDLAFQNSFDGRARVLKTLETPLDSKEQADPNIFVIQKRVTLDGGRTRVSIDPDTNMTIQLNRHTVDNHQEKDSNIHKGILISDEHATHSHHHHHTHPHVTFSSENLHENLSFLYEKELVPLQNMIKDLKAEIDALARQTKRREKSIQQRLRPVGHCSGIVIKK